MIERISNVPSLIIRQTKSTAMIEHVSDLPNMIGIDLSEFEYNIDYH
jgi:hypothetical protein